MLFSIPITPVIIATLTKDKEKNSVFTLLFKILWLYGIVQWYIDIPIVRALAKMTPESMNTMIDARFKIAISFLMKHCPQKPARIDTLMRYRAAIEV